MDWLSEWEPLPYMGIEQVGPGVDSGRLTAWLILALAAVVIAALWYHQRIFRHSFWCATSRRRGPRRDRLRGSDDSSRLCAARPAATSQMSSGGRS
jgi:hypothetical protein